MSFSSFKYWSFKGLNNLRELDLTGNEINSIENVNIIGLGSLSRLSIIGNRITF